MTYVLTWLGLLVFLALTLASSYFPMGPWNTVVNMLISCAKGALIAVFFMDLRNSTGLLRVAAIVGIVWLSLLFGLSWTDLATR